MTRNKLEVIATPRQVIADKLLTALDDESRVAILATEDDLDLLILALADIAQGPLADRAFDYRRDLEQLKEQAFHRAEPSAIVHILKSGLPLCRFTDDVPSNWPECDKWISNPEYGSNVDNVTCTECRERWEKTSHIPER